MASFNGWAIAVLRGIGAPVTPSNLRFLRTWQQAEGGSATYNPLNTTQTMPGAGSYNDVGVRDYRSRQQGIRATVKTLLNGKYTPIIVGLKRSADPVKLAGAVGVSPWGTDGDAIKNLLGVSTSTSGLPSLDSPQPRTAPQSPSPDMHLPQKPDLAGLQNLAGGTYNPTEQLQSLATAPSTPQGVMPTRDTAPQMPDIVAGSSKLDQRAVGLVKEYLGTPYKWGGAAPGGFDCSGLLQYTWAKAGVTIPRTSQEQWKAGRPVKGALRPGDAVFFEGGPSGPGHVGMYIGAGKFIEAPHTGAVVRVSTLKNRKDYVGARRFA